MNECYRISLNDLCDTISSTKSISSATNCYWRHKAGVRATTPVLSGVQRCIEKGWSSEWFLQADVTVLTSFQCSDTDGSLTGMAFGLW